MPKRILTEEEISALSDRLTQDSADIGDTFPGQIEISRSDKKNLTEQQLAKRKNDQKTAGENCKKKRAALREAAKTAAAGRSATFGRLAGQNAAAGI